MNFQNLTLYLTIDNSYVGVGVFLSLLSFIGCIFIIGTFIAFKSLRSTSRTILVYLSIANIGVCIGHIIGAATVTLYKDDFQSWRAFPACRASAAITILFRLSSYLWTCALSLYLCTTLFWKRLALAKKMMAPFHIICWIFPAVIMVGAIVSDVVGFDKGPLIDQQRPPWCWIDRHAPDYVTWAFLAGAGWQFGTIVVCVVAFILIQWSYLPQKKATEESAESEDEVTVFVQTTNSKLKHIPLLFLVLQIWSAWSFLATMYKKSPNWLVIMQVIGDQGQGLVNAVLFCLYTTAVRKKLCAKFSRFLCCCFKCDKLKCSPCKCLKKKQLKIPVELESLRSPGAEGERLMNNSNEMEWDETGMPP